MEVRDHLPGPEDLFGSWKPLTLLGEDVSGVRRIRGNRPLLTFVESKAGVVWAAYNGCEQEHGRVHLGADGKFSTSHRGITYNVCGDVERHHIATADVVIKAGWIGIRGGNLRLYGADGLLLGTFARSHALP